MSNKKVVSWRELVSEEMEKRRKEGASRNLKDVLPKLRPMWEKIKKGEHELYRIASDSEKKIQGTKKKISKTNKRLTKKVKTIENELTEVPGHKGSKSKTRPGRKNFVTHKGSKSYNRDGHYQSENVDGVKGKPYNNRNARKTLKKSGGTVCKLCAENTKKIDELEKRISILENV